MRRKFITNLAFLLSINLLVKPFWILGVDRSVQNMLGAQEYGLYFSLFNFSFLFNVILDVGITNFNNRELAQENKLLPAHFNLMVPLKLVLGVAYGLLLAILAFVLDYGQAQIVILLGLAANQFLLSFILYLRSNFSALHHFRLDSIFSVLDRLLMILFCSLIFYNQTLHNLFTIKWFVCLQTLAYIITATLAFLMTRRFAAGFSPNFQLSFLRTTLKQSYPYALLALLMSAYSRIDGVMIERLLPDGALQSGIYAQAFRLLDVGNNVAFLFGGLLLPIFARMIKQGQEVGRLVALSSMSLLYPALLVAVAANLFGQPIMAMLYHSYMEQSSLVFQLLMCSFVGMCFTYIFGALLTANGSLLVLNAIAGGCLLINLVLNFILIPKYGALGAAISNCATQTVSAVLQFAYARRYFHLQIRFKNLFFIFISFLFASFFCIYFKSIGLNFIFNLLVFFGLNVLMVLVFKVVDVKDIINLRTRDNI